MLWSKLLAAGGVTIGIADQRIIHVPSLLAHEVYDLMVVHVKQIALTQLQF